MKYLALLLFLVGCQKYEVEQCGKFDYAEGSTFEILDKTKESYLVIETASEGRVFKANYKTNLTSWQSSKEVDKDSVSIKCPEAK